ncbi:hypothetical protein M3Y97_00408500 [Aphelenchoides bicaudatus]|nr:hypothetical protein M3Y97_00408500 [Aphelenchoides bicaudatus]
MAVDIIGLIYAGLVSFGGIFGYLKTGSAVSFIAGTSTGFAAAFAALNSNFHLLAAVAGLLTVAMGIRFFNSGKIMPAGVVTVLSILILVRCFYIISRA